eukprot:3701671-Prymnesium_polylepis.2
MEGWKLWLAQRPIEAGEERDEGRDGERKAHEVHHRVHDVAQHGLNALPGRLIVELLDPAHDVLPLHFHERLLELVVDLHDELECQHVQHHLERLRRLEDEVEVEQVDSGLERALHHHEVHHQVEPQHGIELANVRARALLHVLARVGEIDRGHTKARHVDPRDAEHDDPSEEIGGRRAPPLSHQELLLVEHGEKPQAHENAELGEHDCDATSSQ